MARMTREEFLDLLARSNPRTRKTTTRIIEGRASEDNTAFVQEELNFVDPSMTVRSVNLIATRFCDSDHVLDQTTRLVARCRICNALTCSAPGCSFTCARCRAPVCAAHIRVYDEKEAYCSRCMPLAWLRWLIVGKRG
jgi:hypothetical protein